MRINGKLSLVICLVLVAVMAIVPMFAFTAFAADDATGDNYVLVTDVASLSVGDKIVIAATNANYALSTTQSGNNRPQAVITKSGNEITIGNDTQIITLEAGTIDGTFAFNVGDGYLYAAHSSKNYLRTQTTNDDNGSWSITIDANGVATVKANGSNTRNWMRYNSSSSIFSCYSSGQADISIYVQKTGSSEPACEHANQTTTTVEASCTVDGSITVTCDDCGETISEEVIEAGHKYVDYVCSVCGAKPSIEASLSFADKANRTEFSTTDQVWEQNGITLTNNKGTYTNSIGDYCAPARFYKGTTIKIESQMAIAKIVFACNTADYASDLKEAIGSEAVVDGKNVTVVLANPSTSYEFTNSVAQVRLDSLTVYHAPTISKASVTLGTNLAMNYTVAVPTGYDVNGMKMVFTMNGVETVVDTYVTNAAGNAVFTFNRLAPQCMGDTITAELYAADGTLVDTLDYSVKAYAEQLLVDYADNADVVALVVDMLNYGAAAQAYRGYKTDALVNSGITAAGSDVAPTDADNKLTATNKGNRNDYADYGITSAGVRFDYINKVYVKFAAPSLENVTVLVNGVAAEVATTNGGYVVYSDAINALEFDEVVTFELQVGGETIQVLTYSVNTYAFNKANTESEVADLALALYRYGKSAAAYAANN